jgi:hypothetical protein
MVIIRFLSSLKRLTASQAQLMVLVPALLYLFFMPETLLPALVRPEIAGISSIKEEGKEEEKVAQGTYKEMV